MTKPRDAAIVVLLRNPEDLEVFWVRRSRDLRFLGGFHTFPGGAVDPTDASVERAAVRELGEEGGVRLDVADLEPAGRWVTPPPIGTVRFDTRFFVAWLPAGQTARAKTGELETGEWIRPAEALERWERAEVLLAPPTFHALRCAAEGPRELARRMEETARALRGEAERAEIVSGLFVLPLSAPTVPPATHTNTVIVAGERGVLVDPGSPDPDGQRSLVGLVELIARDGIPITQILLTHHHADHAGWADALRARLRVPLRAHAQTASRLPFPVDGHVEDGELLDLGGSPTRRLRALHTPGHAPGHLAFFEETTGFLAAGDLVAGAGFVVVDPDDGGDMAAYLESLRRVRSLRPRFIVPAHGPISTDATATLDEYVAHRLEREGKVLTAVRGGAATPDAMLPTAYDDTPEHMWPLAAMSLRAHLAKLVADGEVVLEAGRYRAVTVK